jgi:arabinose-5-phosphate isomerase
MTNETILSTAIKVIQNEADAIRSLIELTGKDFIEVVRMIHKSSGNVIITGIGKSANIAQKIVATFNSTGTKAVFMHAADAVHGDLGIIREDDIIIALSKSGETPELKVIVPLLKSRGNKLVAITGNMQSYLAQHSDYVIDATVTMEACPNNLAPTSSTTAQLVLGDALAICVLECRGFTAEDFARFHPGGSLGKKMYLRVNDVYVKNECPKVSPNDDLRQVIVEISAKRLGATAVIENQKLIGIITDGDLRRMLMKTTAIETIKARDIMTPYPKSIGADDLVVDALHLMRQHNITQLPVMEADVYKGVIHLHDILNEGIL